MNIPGRGADLVSEMNQRAFYSWWDTQLAAPPRPVKSNWLRVATGD